MDWRLLFFLGSYFIFLTGLPGVCCHPLRRPSKKAHTLARKTKIVKLSQNGDKNKQKKSSFFPGGPIASSASTEDAKKKGTIRISGPWHSDSGLDRNVDPMEDSYVKKIISTNEGLNFNKDMAEAGEVFDVNGIEDFYDRNALITYEVNGHEIPVHMKQKLTPQTQPMFPEYGHDSPVPDTASSRTGHVYNHRRPGMHRATTFYGMSLKDMPEYKVRDTPSFGEKHGSARLFGGRARLGGPQDAEEATFSSRHRLASTGRPGMFDSSTVMPSQRQRTADPQAQLERFSSEYEQANQVGQEDAALGRGFQGAAMPQQFQPDFHREAPAPDSSVAGLNPHSQFNRIRESEEKFSNEENERLKEFANHARFKNEEQLLEEIARLKLQKSTSLFQKPSRVEENFHKRPQERLSAKLKPALATVSPIEEFSKTHRISSFFGKSNSEDRESGKPNEVGIAGDNRGIGKEYDGAKLAPNSVQATKEKEEPKGDDSNKFFEQLEKIDEEKQKSERGKDEMSPGKSAEVNFAGGEKVLRYSDDEERTKAKDKLLKILGDLTSKLKGMEAAVKDTHTDERRESPMDSQENKQETQEHRPATETGYAEAQQKQEAAKEESKEQRAGEAGAPMEHAHQEMEHAHQEMEQAYPDTAKYQDERTAEHQTPGEEMEHAHSSEGETLDVSQDKVSHLISHLKQRNRPFIFNTEEIDYRGPSYEEKSKFNAGDDGEMKDHVHPSKFGGEQSPGSRPIISSFYSDHGSKANHEFDVHSFHNEASLSPQHEVTPTQRDGGGKQGQRPEEKKEAEKLPAPEKKPNAQFHSENENKADPDDDLPDYNEVKDAAIFEENFIRKKYHAPNLHWSDDLSDVAQKEADDLAEENSPDLSKKSLPKGVNVALVPINSLNVGKDSADLWQKEATKFDFVSPYVSKKNSDFAQMVWKTAKEFGLGVAKSKSRENWIVVAKYDTPVVSEFEKLKANIESDIPVADPYSDIARRGQISNE